jgi:alanyl-tRNA synthetase
VGAIVMRNWERAKGLTRIRFMAGLRAVNDYRRVNRTATETAAAFSAGREDSPALVAKLIDDQKALARRVRELDEIAWGVEAEEILHAGVTDKTGVRVIEKIFDDRDADSLKHLAQALVAHPQVVALLGSRQDDTARLVFARSADAPGDMNALMRQACEMIDGRGGGRPDMAQGGGKKVAALTEAIAAASQSLNS